MNLSAIFIKETVWPDKNGMKVVQLAWPLLGYKPLKLGSHVPKHRAVADVQTAVDVHKYILPVMHMGERIATEFVIAVVP